MRKYTIFHPIILAFFSKSLYRDVGKYWPGIGALYLLLILALVWIPFIWLLNVQINEFKKHDAQIIIKQMPKIEILEGQVSINKSVPYIISDPETGKRLLVIDTSGEITSPDKAQSLMLITSDKFYLRQNGQSHDFDLSNIKDFSLTSTQLKQLLDKIGNWLIFIIYPLLIMLTFLYRIVQALIYGVIGVVFSKIVRAGLTYQQCVRVAVIAVTPAILLGGVLAVLNITYPFQYFSYFMLTIAYLYFGIWANKEQDVS